MLNRRRVLVVTLGVLMLCVIGGIGLLTTDSGAVRLPAAASDHEPGSAPARPVLVVPSQDLQLQGGTAEQATPASLSLRCLDYRSQEPVAGLNVVMSGSAGQSWTARTGADGEFTSPVPWRDIDAVEVALPWHVASPLADVAIAGVVYVVPSMEVRVRLTLPSDEAETEIDWTGFVVEAFAVGPRDDASAWSRPRSRFSSAFLTQPGHLRVQFPSVDSSGATAARLRALPHMAVQATSVDWVSDPMRIEAPEDVDAGVDLVLHLRRRAFGALHIRSPLGTAFDPERDDVLVQHIWTGPGGVLDPTVLPRGCALCWHTAKDGTAWARSVSSQPLDVSGLARYTTWPAAETRITVRVRGHLPARIRLAAGTASEDTRIELVPARGVPRVRLLWRGSPLPEATSVGFQDVTDPNRQETTMLTTDEGGAVAAEWIETGRLYGVRPMAPDEARASMWFVAWRGDTEVDLAELPDDLDAFLASHR